MAEEIKSSWAVCLVCGKEFEIVGNRKKCCSKASESVQGIKTMNRQEKEDQAQIEYLRRWKEKKQKRNRAAAKK